MDRKFYSILILAIPLFFLPHLALASTQPVPDVSTVSSLKSIKLTVGSFEQDLDSTDFSQWFNIQPVLVLNPKNQSEAENINYCPLDKSKILCDLVLPKTDRIHFQNKIVTSLNEDAIRQYLNDLATKVNTDPVDAKLQIDNGKVSAFSLSQNGITLDVDKSLNIIENSLNSSENQDSLTINLAYNETQPKINSNNIDNLGINDLIGEGQSNFAGSPRNRIQNIQVGAAQFNGVLIAPGEEFSFIKTLGPVDGDHGYAPELVILQNTTTPEFGGGICQVSTTAFRAALNSGLKITARTNHAYPVSYYNPQGMDATVYIPKPDLKFINNTPNYILIQTKITGTILTFDFYGTNDGRTVQLIGPKVLEHNPDGSMKTTLGQKVTDANGNVIINDTFNSNYNSPNNYPHPGQTPAPAAKPKG
jgi:vancomycin resistance protein YoaR